ncbi:hypothetical protein K4K49_006886 [Colletotrichum sp. SAR 10_70]|nr:hypothetical protein K4K50_006712 [Colletotrichum sp. SAR 10_71]KAI8161872.1 hypothetical protein K4K49_006886 [Colletotrichum sp. SAR 10_70]KAI8189559.1 hypothetical protein KHU50_000699 [Colletotrichum sp. SAR 10_65]KAI8227738.1 hypothetical protein K4K54_002727 [Colletotrichum sp. SAR 10_86]KAI8253627.1 hypothetical protein K4K53_010024 [Colletotrichum sp. SAR 10_77]KAJ4998225.1 hypothetical protein K4K48_005751 [Colletotrichum sp. SAR 10_66]
MYSNPEYDRGYKTVARVRLQLCLEIYMTNDNNPPRTEKSEAFVAPSEQQTADMLLGYVNPDSHGTGGPIVNGFPRLQSPLLRTWPRMLENLGLAVRGDPRDGKALGGYVNLLNIDGATRSFAANAYLGPARCPNT